MKIGRNLTQTYCTARFFVERQGQILYLILVFYTWDYCVKQMCYLLISIYSFAKQLWCVYNIFNGNFITIVLKINYNDKLL